ncbi:MAG: acyl-CoA dehydrogenase, partial [Pseudomonadota bacterium]
MLDTAQRIFADHAEAAPLWQALEETGLTFAATPEDQGGAGLPPGAVFALHRTAGAAAAPAPFAETLTARRLLAAAGIAAPEGPLAFAAGGAVAAGRLSADLPEVAFGGEAGHVVVLAEAEGASRLALARASQADARPVVTAGEDPEADLTF